MARPATINADGVWNTIISPRALRYAGSSDKTYVGWVGAAGAVSVTSIDHDTGVKASFTLRTIVENDHSNPALRVNASGKIQAFYSAHAGSTMYHRTATAAEDISAWATEQTETFGIGSPSFTYPQPLDLSASVVLLIFRQGTSTSGDFYISESTDDGVTWGNAVALFDAGAKGAYVIAKKDPASDRVDFVASDGNPNVQTTSVYHFYRDASGDYRKSDGTLVSTGTASLPLTTADLTTIWNGTTEAAKGFIWDIAHDSSGDPVILFAELTSETDHTMHHAAWNGLSWDVNVIDAVGGSILPGAGQIHASAGGCLDPADATRVFIAVNQSVDPGRCNIYQYDTSDGGATWVQGTNLTNDYTKNFRPAIPLGASPKLSLVWCRGRYDDYNDYTGGIMGVGTDPAVGASTLTLVTSGEIFTAVASSADDPFVIGDWESQAGVASKLVHTEDGTLEHSGTGSSTLHYIRCSASTSRTARMVQAVHFKRTVLGGTTQVFHGGHYETGAVGNQQAGVRLTIDRSTELFLLDHLEGNGSTSSTNATVAAKDARNLYRATAVVDGLDVDGHDFASGSSLALTGASHGSGYSGFGGFDTDELRCCEFFDCAGPLLTASGLATGDKLQLRNTLGVVIAEAAEVAGTATIDMTEVPIPEVNDLVVIDSGGSLLGGVTLAGSGGPKEYARGGDSYGFSATPPVPAPATPSVTAASGITQLTATSSVYSHPGGAAHAFSRWQTVVDGGDPDNPGDIVHDSGLVTQLEAYESNPGAIPSETALDQYVTHIDEFGNSARSGPFDFTSGAIGGAAGMLLEFLDAAGAVLTSYEVLTEATDWTELVLEEIEVPVGFAHARMTPIKRGENNVGATIRHASFDKGAMAIGFKPRPYMPEADDYFDAGGASDSAVIDWSRARMQRKLLDQNANFTFAHEKVGQQLRIVFVQDATGGRTIGLPAAVIGEPAWSATADAVDVADFVVLPGGVILVANYWLDV